MSLDAPAASGPVRAYDVLVPVKPLDRAKTRLHGHPRGPLMRAFALDAVSAALAASRVARVHVVTDDADLGRRAADLGALVLPDRGAGDLNAALVAAAGLLGDGSEPAVAAMLGDLPCLLPADLDAALAEADRLGGGFVPDAEGTGTTLLAAHGPLLPRFGPGSRDAHRAAGVAEVGLGAATLRRDVDTAADLDLARALGLGPRTAAVLRGPD